MIIKFTLAEMMLAAYVGVMREVENIKLGRQQAYGMKTDCSFQNHIEGAIGEMVVSKYLGTYWDGKGTLRGPDAGGMQVRATCHPLGRLILHPEDKNEDKFWLVVLTPTQCEGDVRGWILGQDGKRPEYWEDPTGKNRFAFFVPKLNPA